MIQLRDYQIECIDILDNKGQGRYLVQMATGLGKTVTFANIRRQGRMLILSQMAAELICKVQLIRCTQN